MKKNIFLIPLVGFFLSGAVLAAEESLEGAMESLKLEENILPPSASKEKLYAVQSRYNPLSSRLELSIGGANNFNPDSFQSSQELNGNVRFYLSDRWYLGLGGSYVFNKWTATGKRLVENNGIVPDVTYPKYRGELLGGFHTFYGKLRFTMESVLYFDQYVSIGPGVVGLRDSTQPAAVADIGFAFWMGKHFSSRIGLKDYFFEERRVKSRDMVHHLLGHFDVGYVFGDVL